MDAEERRLIGTRITTARKQTGLTQRELADLLGVTTRSIQNYESGAVVPYRHLRRIEAVTRKRPGWILDGHEQTDVASLVATAGALYEAIERQQALLQDQLSALRRETERMRVQRGALQPRRPRTD